MADVNMEGLIDYLGLLIAKQFSDDISTFYFGDVGVYPPRAFQHPKGHQGVALAIVPLADDFDDENGATAHAEFRKLKVHVVCLVNMVPYFEAMPSAAPAERELVRVVSRIREFLAHQSNFDLNKNVTASNVGNIKWNWVMRDNNALRAAAIEYEATVYVIKHE